MKQQNFENHARIVPLFHFGTATVAGLLFIASIVHLFYSTEANLMLSIIVCILCFTVVLAAFFTRVFALKAQDRAIRAEENFRHYIRTGNPLDPKLTISQIIALRFAPDEEYDALAKRAITAQLSSKQIKQSIQHWKADYYRV